MTRSRDAVSVITILFELGRALLVLIGIGW
jgi:hypothetical protein